MNKKIRALNIALSQLYKKEYERICEEKILPLMPAEERSLLGLTEEEQALLLRLNQKQCDALEAEIQKLTGGKSDES